MCRSTWPHLVNGGTVIECSDWFFSPPNNMLQPGESRFMADGWETRAAARRRARLGDHPVGAAAIPRVVEIDTTHYKGNSPDRVSLAGLADGEWAPILAEQRLQPDTSHRFLVEVDRPVEQVRLDIFPDGGIGRIRVYGRLTEDAVGALTERWARSLPGRGFKRAREVIAQELVGLEALSRELPVR